MKKILLVEDQALLSEPLSKHLELAGYQVSRAYNGEEGLNSALSEHPDLILLDRVMPIMDGDEMLAQLRKDSWGKDAKVIILSNLADQEKYKEVDKKVIDYIVKMDVKMDEIVEKIKLALG